MTVGQGYSYLTCVLTFIFCNHYPYLFSLANLLVQKGKTEEESNNKVLLYPQVCSDTKRSSKAFTTFTKAQYSDAYQFNVLSDHSSVSSIINWNIIYPRQDSCYSNFTVSSQLCTEDIPFCPKFCLFPIIV